jgi:hypothetical protein
VLGQSINWIYILSVKIVLFENTNVNIAIYDVSPIDTHTYVHTYTCKATINDDQINLKREREVYIEISKESGVMNNLIYLFNVNKSIWRWRKKSFQALLKTTINNTLLA